MKKFFILTFLLIFALFGLSATNNIALAQDSVDCDFAFDGEGNPTDTIGSALDKCFKGDKSKLVQAEGELNIGGLDDGFRTKIQGLIQTLGSVLALLAVGSIVYGSLLLVLSGGEEEKLKKGKDVVKWGILGFLGVVFAGVLITIVVNIMFSI